MIRVFIGTDSSIHGVAEKVIEHSIRKNTDEDVHIEFIRPGWKSGCTGFTNHRFLIPAMCSYTGFAIYLDVDMLVLGDIAELWAYKTPGKWCTTAIRDDVAVIDCAAFTDITPGTCRNKKKDAIRGQIGGRRLVNIQHQWNTIDMLTLGTKLVHYSDLDRQPWHPIPGHPYKQHPDADAVALFWEYFEQAKAGK